MASLANLPGVLSSCSQVFVCGKDAEGLHDLRFQSGGRAFFRLTNSKRMNCSHSLTLSAGHCRATFSDGRRLHVLRPTKASRSGLWQSSVLRIGNAKVEPQVSHFSNFGVHVDGKGPRRLQSSNRESQNSSSEPQDDLEGVEDNNRFLPHGSLAAEEEEEAEATTEEGEIHTVEFSSDAVVETPSATPAAEGFGDKARKWISSIVRTLSGVPFKEVEQQTLVLRREQDAKRKPSLWRNPLRLLYETDPSPAAPYKNKIAAGFRRAETDFFAFSRQLGKYVIIMSGLGAILVAGMELGGGSPHEQGILGFSWLAGVVLGSMIGAGQVMKEHAMAQSRNVVITGSTRGLGKAIAREFLYHGDNVVITSRNADSVQSTVEELRREIQEHSGSRSTFDARLELFGLPSAKRRDPRVVGITCDVSKSDDVQALADYAVQEFGTVDLWINNAGVNKGFRPLLEFSNDEIEQIVSTNLTGSMICTREAIKVMQNQPKGGHIFNMDGAGSGGSSTPLTAVYGATKCGLRQLSTSLLQENKGSRVGIHTASPGMVLTDLLLSGASLQNKKMFNFICEQPETVARALVPNLRVVNGTGKAVNYLTPARIVFAIVSLWIRRGRWFDEEGRAVYAAEAERLRLWAEGRERSSVTAAMELVPSGTWVSIASSSLICAYLILSSASNASSGNLPGI